MGHRKAARIIGAATGREHWKAQVLVQLLGQHRARRVVKPAKGDGCVILWLYVLMLAPHTKSVRGRRMGEARRCHPTSAAAPSV